MHTGARRSRYEGVDLYCYRPDKCFDRFDIQKLTNTSISTTGL